MRIVQHCFKTSVCISLLVSVGLCLVPEFGSADSLCETPAETPIPEDNPLLLDDVVTSCGAAACVEIEVNLKYMKMKMFMFLDEAKKKQRSANSVRQAVERLCQQIRNADLAGHGESVEAQRRELFENLGNIETTESNIQGVLDEYEEAKQEYERLLEELPNCEKQYCESVIGEPGSGILVPVPGDDRVLKPPPQPPPPLPVLPEMDTVTYCPACQGIVDQYNGVVDELNNEIHKYNQLLEEYSDLFSTPQQATSLSLVVWMGKVNTIMTKASQLMEQMRQLMMALDECEAGECPNSGFSLGSHTDVGEPIKKATPMTVQGRVDLASPTDLNTNASHIQVTVSPRNFVDFSEFFAPEISGHPWGVGDSVGPPYLEIPIVQGKTTSYEFTLGDGVNSGDSVRRTQHRYDLQADGVESRVTLSMGSYAVDATAKTNVTVRYLIPNYPVFLDSWKPGFDDLKAKTQYQQITGQPVAGWIPWRKTGLGEYEMISQWPVSTEGHQNLWPVPGVSDFWIGGEHDPETNVAPVQGLFPETWPVDEDASPLPQLFFQKHTR